MQTVVLGWGSLIKAPRGLLFLDGLAPPLADYETTASEAQQREFLAHLHRTLNAPASQIRHRLRRLSGKEIYSPVG